MPTASSLAWKTSLRKVRTLWHCRWLRSVALYLWLIVVISVRQSTVAAASWASLPGAGYGQFEHKADSLIAKFKEAGGAVRDWCTSRSPRLSPLWLSASSSACLGLLIITVITPLPTSPARQKCQRTEAGERSNYWHADASAWCLLRSGKYTENSGWCWAEMMLCVMMLPSVVVGCTSKQSVESVREATTASGVDNAASPTGRHRWTGLFHPQREADHYAKTTGRNPSILMTVQIELPISMGNSYSYCKQYPRFQRVLNA